MSEDHFKAIQKAERKAKRIAAEKAMELHDLVEDGLPGKFEDLPQIAQATYDACKVWAEANAALKSAEEA